MTAARITKRTVVLELASRPRRPGRQAGYALPVNRDAPDGVRHFTDPMLTLPGADFTALGSPERITVHIEPGDRLNEEADRG